MSPFLNVDLIRQAPEFTVVLDTKSKFVAANKVALDWTGFKSEDELYGKSYAEMNCKAALQAEEFLQQDNIIINKLQGHGKIAGLYCYNKDIWKLILAEKFPIKDSQGKITNIVSRIFDLTHSNILDINRFINLTGLDKNKKLVKEQKGFLISNQDVKNKLSNRQNECLFFLLRGKTSKAIAEILGVSTRTVEAHINEVKVKFGCTTKSQIIEKAIHDGYMNTIPHGLWA